MGLPERSVSRPVTFFMIYIALLAIGLVSAFNLGTDIYPDISFPTVTVVTSYEGVSSEDIETLVTRPVEENVAAIEDVDEVSSFSREGVSIVMVTFKWGKDMDVASMDVRERIDFVKPFLPEDAEEPFVFKFSTEQMPILFLAVTGDYDIAELRKVVEDQIEPRIERVRGIASAFTQGGRDREIHVYADDEKLEAYGLTIQDLQTALMLENVRVPGGSIKQGRTDFLVRTSGEFKAVDDIRNVVVTRYQGAPVFMKDVATVEDTFADEAEIIRFNGEPGIMLMLQKQSTYNTVEVSDRVKAQLPAIEQALGVKFVPLMDSARYINRSIGNLRTVALQGAILAIIVLFLFLRNVPSTLIIATSIPVSIVATFIIMNATDVTLNMISMGGLTLGIGMLVDSSIVVLENIYRHRERGLTRKEAATYGAAEVATPITASVLTTVAVFFPVIFVPGIAGILFRDMALTVTFALICSLFVALTLIPLLSSKVLTVGRKAREEVKERRITRSYERVLRWALAHRKTTLGIALLIFVFSLSLMRYVGVEFTPASEPGEFNVKVELPVGTRIERTEEATAQVESIIISQVPELEAIFARVGQGSGFGAFFGGEGSHSANIYFQAVPLEDRDRSDEQIRFALSKPITRVPGAEVYFATDAFSEMMFGGARLKVEIYGHDLDTSRDIALRVKEIMEGIPGTMDVRISRAEGKPEIQVAIDRERAAYFGLNLSSIAHAIQTGVMGDVAGQFREEGDEYNIRVRLPEERRRSLSDIMDILVPSPQGHSVPLGSVASMKYVTGPVEIERLGQRRVINVTGNLTGERDLGSVVGDLREALKQVEVPRDFIVQVAGEAEDVAESFRWLGLALMGAIFLVYMVMASQFESLRHPFIIMFSLPLSFIGVAWMLFLSGTTLSINSFTGVIVLAGIVVNNAIILVDYTNLLRARGADLEEAVVTAAKTRARPILMTAVTTILAMTPMALGLGEGGELNAPLARSVVGGLSTSTLLTLVIIPVVYMSFEKFTMRFSRKKPGGGD
ncbi:MAG: efflux RND transporter permease subunit [bacterium]|jgi:HAE1 family hydrophobic/amphiphilic exporter-1